MHSSINTSPKSHVRLSNGVEKCFHVWVSFSCIHRHFYQTDIGSHICVVINYAIHGAATILVVFYIINDRLQFSDFHIILYKW